MAKPTLEKRVAALEHQLAELKANLANGNQPKDWRSTIGMFAGDDVMKQIDEAGRKIREADREKARKAAARAERREAQRQAAKAEQRKRA